MGRWNSWFSTSFFLWFLLGLLLDNDQWFWYCCGYQKKEVESMKRELLDNGNIWQKSDGRWIGILNIWMMMLIMMKMMTLMTMNNTSDFLCEQPDSRPVSPCFALCVVCWRRARKYPSKLFTLFLSVCCGFWTVHYIKRFKSTSIFAYCARPFYNTRSVL